MFTFFNAANPYLMEAVRRLCFRREPNVYYFPSIVLISSTPCLCQLSRSPSVYSNNNLILRLVPKLKYNKTPPRLADSRARSRWTLCLNLFVSRGRLKYDSGRLPLMFTTWARSRGPVSCSWSVPFVHWTLWARNSNSNHQWSTSHGRTLLFISWIAIHLSVVRFSD